MNTIKTQIYYGKPIGKFKELYDKDIYILLIDKDQFAFETYEELQKYLNEYN